MNDLINQFDNEFNNETSLNDAILDIIETESVDLLPARRVSDEVVFEVASRALTASASLDPESRYFSVLREVSSFLTLAIHGSRPNGEVTHTDLLPAGHPNTTAEFSMSDAEYRRKAALWIAADPRIEDEHVRAVVASAFAANPYSPECLFTTTRLRSLDATLVPVDILLNPLVAAFGDNPYAGKNNRANRSARAKAQRRDRFGQFAEQGGGVRFYVRKGDGSTSSVVGRYAGNGTDPKKIEVEITDVEGIKNGIYSVPADYMEFIQAVLPEHAISKITPMAPSIDVPVLNMKDLKRQALPSLWAATKVPATLRGLKDAVTPDENYVSGDGYQVGLFKKLSPAVKAHLENVSKEFSPKIVGTNGTNQLDPSKPIYQIVSSMSGDNKVIGLAQNWNDTQNILADEDEANPENFNQAPIARIPEAEVKKQEDLIDEMSPEQNAPEISVEEDVTDESLPDMVPSDWAEREPNYFYSPDGQFGVSIGSAYAGERTVDQETGDGDVVAVSEPILLDNAFTVVSGPDDLDPDVLGVAFNWNQVERLLDLVDPNRVKGEDFTEAIKNEKMDYQGIDEMAGELINWDENPTMTEAAFDKAVASGQDPQDVASGILSPNSRDTVNDPDAAGTLKTYLFPESAFDSKDSIDEMADYTSMEQYLEPTPFFLKRSDASSNPSDAMLKRLRASYTAHKHNIPMQAAVEEILQNPENHTVAEALSLTARVNAQELEPVQANGYPAFKAVSSQRKALLAIMKGRELPEEERKALDDQLHFLTQTMADSLIKRFNDDEKYPPIQREASVKQRQAAGEVLPDPEWITSDIPESEGGPSLGQMLKMETALENRQVPDAERSEFIANYKNLSGDDFKELIKKFETYPYKGIFQPQYLETRMGAKGATPRMLAAFERILGKNLVSPEEQEDLLDTIPYMTKQSAGFKLSGLKKLEDDYDTEMLDQYLRDGMDPVNLRVPDNYFITPEFDDVAAVVTDSDGVRHVMVKSGDFEERAAELRKNRSTEDVVTSAEQDGLLSPDLEGLARKAKARRHDAKVMRQAILRTAGELTLAMFDNRMTPQGRRIIEGALADLHLLRASLDLRKRKNRTPEQVDDFLREIRDNLGLPMENQFYGKLRSPNPRMLDALHEAGYSVNDLVGIYKAGQRAEDSIDEMSSDINMPGEMPEDWDGAAGMYDHKTKKYSVLNADNGLFKLYDSRFNPLRPRYIATVDNWKDVEDTIWYTENVRTLPDYTNQYLADPSSLDYDVKDAWRVAKGLPELEEDAQESIDEYVGKSPDLGYIDAPSFYGPAFNELPDETDYESVINYLNANENVKDFYVFDFETTGLRNLATPHIKNDPVQIAIAKVSGGKVVDSISYYMNPESPLSDWSAGREANSDGLKGPDGLTLTDAWLSEQMSKREAMEKFREFVPEGAVMAGHNGFLFDMEILNRTMKEAGLPEFKAGGFIDTLGLARHVVPSPRNNPNGVSEEEMPKRHTLGALLDFFKVELEGDLHNAKTDVEGTAKLLYKILEFGQEGKAINGPQFKMSDAANGFNFPKYKALVNTFKSNAAKWIAENADELIANGASTNIDDLIKYLDYPFNATGAMSTGAGSMKDEDPGNTEATAIRAPGNDQKPTEKQINSLIRRLNDPEVFTSDEARDRVYNAIPTMTKESIGSYIQLADFLELQSRMRKGEPIDDLRIPPSALDYVIGYKPTVSPESDSIDEMASRKDKVTLEEIRKVKVDFKKMGLKRTPTAEQEDIIKAIVGGYSVAVMAMAGVGKTSTVEASAASVAAMSPKLKQAYLAFNNNIAEEARTRLPDSVEVRTMDSLSYLATANEKLRTKFEKQGKSPKHAPVSLYDNSIGLLGYMELLFPKIKGKETESNVFSRAIDKYKDITVPKMNRETKKEEMVTLPKEYVVKTAGQMVRLWAISGDDEMGEKHMPVPTGDELSIPFTPELLDLAKFMWQDVLTPYDEDKPQLKVEFDLMFKNWALTKPDLRRVNGELKSNNGFKKGAPDILYVDEAQDINEVFYQMLREQSELHNNGLQIVLVGDSNQSIYQFRGAMDALGKLAVDITLPLSMSFRSGEEIADAANLFLDMRYGKGVGSRLLGNPDIDSEIVEAETMTDPDAILVNTNLGALDAIIEMGKSNPNAIIGVTPNFRSDFELLVKTARWLIGKQDPKYKPKRLLPALESFKNWKEVQEEYQLHKSPSIGKYMSLISKAKEAAEELDSANKTDFAALNYLENLTGRLRIKAEGFSVPNDIGKSGQLGNALKYRIEGGQLIIENDSRVPSFKLKYYQGTTNNKGILNLNGFKVPRFGEEVGGADKEKLRAIETELLGEKSKDILDKDRIKELERELEQETKRGGKAAPSGTRFYGYVAPLEGDGREQLERLVMDLSGENIDTAVTTVHRGKGLEFDKVRIWDDFPAPEMDADTLDQLVKDSIKDAQQVKDISGVDLGERGDEANLPKFATTPELNKYYTAFTRAAKVLDPGGLDWIFEYSKGGSTKKAPVSEAQKQVISKEKQEAEKRQGASDAATGKLGKGIEYEVSGDNLIVSGKTAGVEGILKGMGFVFRQDGKVWFLKIGKSADAAEALGKRMKIIEALKKRIDLS